MQILAGSPKKKNILWISQFVPYDRVGHAGGKTENYYLKKVQKSGEYEIFLISFYKKYEEELIDLNEYGIENYLICGESWFKPYVNFDSTINPYHKYAGSLQRFHEIHIKKGIKKYKKNKQPDIIILQWTSIVLLADYLKKSFPGVPIIAIEEDVQFISYKRYFENELKYFKKKFFEIRYKKLKHIEIKSLHTVDRICVNNEKDKKILEENGIENEKVFRWIFWFDNYLKVNNKAENKDILFYGAMDRPENYLSAIWFIENVFSKIEKEGYRFFIVGNKPHKKLLKYTSENIVITGFVEDVSKYFQGSMCFVAPLVLGAGMKVKILEAMSSGIPVLTNYIGIEGIPAQNGVEYLHCEEAEEYIKKIYSLKNNTSLRRRIGKNAKNFIFKTYNIDESYNKFYNVIKSLTYDDK